jgi:uncharacterized membrane protein YphA (DoxX/SURF4 family)
MPVGSFGWEGGMGLVVLVARFGLAALFISAGVAKLAAYDEFVEAVRGYELLPAGAATALGRALPFVEVTCGLLMGGGVAVGVTAPVLAALLLCFAVAIAINLARGRVIDCGCASSLVVVRIGWSLVVRNVVLCGCAVVVAVFAPDVLAVGPAGAWIGLATGGGSGEGVAAAVIAVEATMCVVCVVAAVRVSRALTRLVGEAS